jgi:hypothetical protein
MMLTPCAGFRSVSQAFRQVPGTRHLGPDTRYRIDAEGRVPSTEDRARPPENAHTGYAIQPSSPSRPVQSSLNLPAPSPSRRGAWPTPVTSSLHHSVTPSLRHSVTLICTPLSVTRHSVTPAGPVKGAHRGPGFWGTPGGSSDVESPPAGGRPVGKGPGLAGEGPVFSPLRRSSEPPDCRP